MDRYFYLIETTNGEKLMHLSGNVYSCDSGSYSVNRNKEPKDYKCAEWTNFCMEIAEVKKLVDSGDFLEYIGERVNYLDDITKAEADEICKNYFNGNPCTELHISDITEDTPIGNYWFDVEEPDFHKQDPEVPAREWVMKICDAFEDVLEEYDVTIPSEDRSGNTEEARLFGEPFDKLASAVTEILDRLAGDVKENPQSKFDFDRY